MLAIVTKHSTSWFDVVRGYGVGVGHSKEILRSPINGTACEEQTLYFRLPFSTADRVSTRLSGPWVLNSRIYGISVKATVPDSRIPMLQFGVREATC